MPTWCTPVHLRRLAAALPGPAGLTGLMVSSPDLPSADPLKLLDGPWLHARQVEVLAWHAAEPVAFCIGFFVAFAVLSATALPGCGVLALFAGMCFGWLVGTLVARRRAPPLGPPPGQRRSRARA